MKSLLEFYTEFAESITPGGSQYRILCDSVTVYFAGAAAMASQFAQNDRSVLVLEDIRESLAFLVNNLKKELEKK